MFVIPNVITHGFMALDVFQEIGDGVVNDAIMKHPKVFTLGSNGPDILFYSNVLPWQNKEINEWISQLGQRVHTEKINEFYTLAINYINQINDPLRKEVLIAYLAGHLMHWVLDVKAHPFVFYRSGPLEGDTKYWHYRYESMLDALMIAYVKGLKFNDLSPSELVEVEQEERRYIATMYSYLLHELFGETVDGKELDDTMKNMVNVLKILYDPHHLKFPGIHRLEKTMKQPWLFTSHMVTSKIEVEPDVLNLKKETWYNPTDKTIASNKSFIELYEEAVEEGVDVLKIFDLILEGNPINIEDVLENRQYDTGLNTDQPMQYYDVIYK